MMSRSKPLAVDLFCGLGGFTEGLLAEGWNVLGFDIERHVYGPDRYPAQLVIQDVLTIDGRKFRGKVDLIVASPPCQEFSYMAMPWTRAKQIAQALRGRGAFPTSYSGSRTKAELTRLFDAALRIGREAECPVVIENVRGAQPWVGPAKAAYGSFLLWGDVPAVPHFGDPFPVPHKARKVPGSRFDGSGKTFQTASVDAVKTVGHANRRDGHSHTRHLTNQAEHDAVKGFKDFHDSPMCHFGSKSSARKAASARIAKIPSRLSRWIARYYFPEHCKERAS